MTFCILPNIHFGEFPLGENPPALQAPRPQLLSKPPAPQLLESSSPNLENTSPQGGFGLAERVGSPPFINKTLFKYLNIAKEQIDVRLDQWDKYKKC